MSDLDWEFVKNRTAATGAVWRSPDGARFKRTGGPEVGEEARMQRKLAALGYPVPRVEEDGADGDLSFFVEDSIGAESLHDAAVASVAGTAGPMSDAVVDAAADVSARLLAAQAAHPVTSTPGGLNDWFEKAGFTANVFSENPDLDTAHVHEVIGAALKRLEVVPMCWAHLDYGLPNAFPGGVIDWQHHGLAPLGYDVGPMLDIIAFKGGGKGYTATAEQRARYLAALDQVSVREAGVSVSDYMGEYLLAKSFFFLALMRPADESNAGKVTKWKYRRALFTMGIEQYERTGSIDTAAFPTFDQFDAHAGDRVTGRT
ncbi:phosphotransferase [Streptomyces sp. NPDC002082]|uniref:phosphotransferase n=1 Tax=Streptomyces sp. NPDC002082 TaxID=3154772 RepID=UPI0033176A4A